MLESSDEGSESNEECNGLRTDSTYSSKYSTPSWLQARIASKASQDSKTSSLSSERDDELNCLVERNSLDKSLTYGIKRREQYANLGINEMGVSEINDDNENDMLLHLNKDGASEEGNELPSGWEKHEDEDGAYYWHIKSGTIQRHAPEHSPRNDDTCESGSNNSLNLIKPTSLPTNSRKAPAKLKVGKGTAISFSVKSLGWVEVPESQLSSELSAQVVEECIRELNKEEIEEFGFDKRGRDKLLELYDDCICLIDMHENRISSKQPLHLVRVWGTLESSDIGENGAEFFAYVARNRYSTGYFRCYVYQCLGCSAADISVALHEKCDEYLSKRREDNCNGGSNRNASPLLNKEGLKRPDTLPTKGRDGMTNFSDFVTPQEEPKKAIREMFYVGSKCVSEPSGVDTLNDCINEILEVSQDRSQWIAINVEVAPSTVSLYDDITGDIVVETRVRYLSFLGVSRQDSMFAGFITVQHDESFMCHVVYSANTNNISHFCKTIEAACTLRYQKFLDAHANDLLSPTTAAAARESSALDSFGSKIMSLFGLRK